MATRERVKATFEIGTEAKHKLATFKADLRRDWGPVTEALIVEALIMYSSEATVRKALNAFEQE